MGQKSEEEADRELTSVRSMVPAVTTSCSSNILYSKCKIFLIKVQTHAYP